MTSTGCVILLHFDVTGVCALTPEQIKPIYPPRAATQLDTRYVRYPVTSLPRREKTGLMSSIKMALLGKCSDSFCNVAETPFANGESQEWTSDRHRVWLFSP